MSIDLDVLDRDLETVRDMIELYAGNSQWEAWQRVESAARNGGEVLALAATILAPNAGEPKND